MTDTTSTDISVPSTTVTTSTGLTVEQFRHALPDHLKKTVNQELIDRVNATLSDPEMFENYRDNLMSHANVMLDGKFKMESYVDAVKYCSHKLLGATNIDAYVRTFPDKYQGFIQRNVSSKDIASYVSAFNKNKLVNLIMAQTIIPTHVLNQDIHQKAVNQLANLMMTAKSEKVQADAANALLTHLKPPEVKKIELDIGVKQDGAIAKLREATMALAAQQRDMIRSGASTAEAVAHSKLIVDVEAREVP